MKPPWVGVQIEFILCFSPFLTVFCLSQHCQIEVKYENGEQGPQIWWHQSILYPVFWKRKQSKPHHLPKINNRDGEHLSVACLSGQVSIWRATIPPVTFYRSFHEDIISRGFPFDEMMWVDDLSEHVFVQMASAHILYITMSYSSPLHPVTRELRNESRRVTLQAETYTRMCTGAMQIE